MNKTDTIRQFDPDLIEAAIFTVEAIRQALLDDDIDRAADTLRTAQNYLGAVLAIKTNPQPPDEQPLYGLRDQHELSALCPKCGRRMFSAREHVLNCASST